DCQYNPEYLNLDQGKVAIKGYDPVSYFKGGPVLGNAEITAEHCGARYQFSSETNRGEFENNPSRFEPSFGGFNPYSLAFGAFTDIDPKVYDYYQGRLVFFINEITKKRFSESKEIQEEAFEYFYSLQYSKADVDQMSDDLFVKQSRPGFAYCYQDIQGDTELVDGVEIFFRRHKVYDVIRVYRINYGRGHLVDGEMRDLVRQRVVRPAVLGAQFKNEDFVLDLEIPENVTPSKFDKKGGKTLKAKLIFLGGKVRYQIFQSEDNNFECR
ncbi:MAG: hypothetical protein MJK18_13480, partial [Bdellovibrionales bacterium]|nr:hypothetical protein [Bdellovibrionales bacterium]